MEIKKIIIIHCIIIQNKNRTWKNALLGEFCEMNNMKVIKINENTSECLPVYLYFHGIFRE